MTKFDVVIRNGEIVTAAGSVGCADIGIADGVIAQIGGTLDGRLQLDAAGKLVLPGGIDPHVHLSFPYVEEKETFRWVDDFAGGSAAALAGGITTLGNMTFPLPGETPVASLKREAAVVPDDNLGSLPYSEEEIAMSDERSHFLDIVRAVTISPNEARRIVAQYRKQSTEDHRDNNEWQRQERIAGQIIARYARLAAIVGGGSSLTGVVPGLGTVVAATGGTALDSVTCMKLQADMCFCLAEAFGYDITSEDARNLAFLVAAGATLEKADVQGVVKFASRAGVRLLRRHLRKAALQTAKRLFARVALAFAGGALAKSLPFGLGVIAGSYTSFARIKRTGQQATQWFLLDRSMTQEADLGQA